MRGGVGFGANAVTTVRKSGIIYLVHQCTISGHLSAHLSAAPIWCSVFLCILKIRRFESRLAKEAKLKETRRDGSRASVAAAILEVSLISKSCSRSLSILNNRKKEPHHMGAADKWADPHGRKPRDSEFACTE